MAARQEITREWWTTASGLYRLVTSRLTLDECADGDPTAAAERLEVVTGIPLLAESTDAEMLASLLIERKAVPKSQPRDASHIAIAAIHGVQFIYLHLEFQTHTEPASPIGDRFHMQRCWICATRHLHSRAIEGDRR